MSIRTIVTGPVLALAMLAFTATANAKVVQTHSVNWGGYAAYRSSKPFNKITATWVQPAVRCNYGSNNQSHPLMTAWVGLDGWGGSTVEQTGSQAFCTEGQPTQYDLWWEMYAAGTKPLPDHGTFAIISAGDKVTATVVYTAPYFILSVKDLTTGNYYSATSTCGSTPCPRSSAEAIVEFGNAYDQSQPLADYGTVHFAGIALHNGAGKTGGMSSRNWTAARIKTIDAATGNTLQTASTLNTTGNSFTMTWKNGL